MSNKNYESGRRFEYRVRDYLEAKGYLVMRTAGSHSPFDLIATTYYKTLFVQCKHGEPITKHTKETMIKLHNKVHGNCIVAYSKKGGQIEFYSWKLIEDGFGNSKWNWKKIDVY